MFQPPIKPNRPFLATVLSLIVGLLFSSPSSLAKATSYPKQLYFIEMRDGAKLAIDIYPPTDYAESKYPDGVPLVLVRTIYNKDLINEAAARWLACFVNNGYAFAIQDIRGTYASKAAGQGFKQYDGYDTIEWLAEQQWCNGKIGMLGLSALGAAQYEAAVTAPPHLVCAIPAQAPGNYYTDSCYPPQFRKADMETILRGPFTARTAQLLASRARSRETSRLDRFNTPMIHSTGWYDFYTEGAVEMFRALREYGGPLARGTQRLFIGPWGHGCNQELEAGKPLTLPGGLSYPANAKLDWETEFWLPWFDYWLKGEETGVMKQPAVKYYLMGAAGEPAAPGNMWIEADDFPPPAVEKPYFIGRDHTLGPAAPNAEEAGLSFVYDPRDPVPTVGRSDEKIPVKGPFDQRPVEDRPDVLIFTTPVMTEPLYIVGQVKVRLWAASDRTDTDFTAKLTDVYPDGRSMIIADGIVKGRYRRTYLTEELLEPGRVYEFEIDLGYTAIVIAPGHRLRLAVSSSNFDRFDINPNTGEPYGVHAVTQALLTERFGVENRETPLYSASLVATNTVYMDAARPSQVILPLVDAAELKS